MSVNTRIRQFIVDNFLFGRGNDLADDSSFMEMGIIDSTGVLELISFLEQEYGVVVEDNELLPENLDSINKVSGFVIHKLAATEVTQDSSTR